MQWSNLKLEIYPGSPPNVPQQLIQLTVLELVWSNPLLRHV